MEDDKGKYNSIYFVIALTGVFSLLKLTGTIDWSWWAVLTPIWVALFFVIIVWIVIELILF